MICLKSLNQMRIRGFNLYQKEQAIGDYYTFIDNMSVYGKLQATKDNQQFVQRFRGRAHRIPKEGPQGLLIPTQPIATKPTPRTQRRHSEAQLFTPEETPRPKATISQMSPQRRKQRSNSLSTPIINRKDLLSPSKHKQAPQKLPVISSNRQIILKEHTSRQLQVSRLRLEENELIAQKLGKNGSKYSQWKCPSKVNEEALRFFQFGESGMKVSRKSTMI